MTDAGQAAARIAASLDAGDIKPGRNELSAQDIADLRAVLDDRERLAARVVERDAENELLNDERAEWQQLYEAYCKPEDVRAMEEQRDAANGRADHHAEQNRHLVGDLAELRELLKERGDYSQRTWLAWRSARDRAHQLAARVAVLESAAPGPGSRGARPGDTEGALR